MFCGAMFGAGIGFLWYNTYPAQVFMGDVGLMNFQPSELAKLGIAMYAASYMMRKMDVKENFMQAVWPMAVALALIGLLLLAEPDMGAFMVIAMIALGILFLGGVNGRMFALVVAVLAAPSR